MDKQYTEQFHKNYILAIRQVMADREELATYNEVADWLDMGRQSLYKIMNDKQAPTVEQGIVLCKKGGFSGNWMFLNEGERKKELQYVLNEISKLLKKQTR